MGKLSARQLVTKCEKIFTDMIENGDTLSKQRILEILTADSEGYYSIVVDALSQTGKVTKMPGRTGGIRYRRAQRREPRLTDANKESLKDYFSNGDIEIPEIDEPNRPKQNPKEIAKERVLYSPLRSYLDASGIYDIVEETAHGRNGGGKWTNPDLIAVIFSSELKFHAGLFPRVHAFEVKPGWPSIENIQQTASYLRFSNSAYLCFHDTSYKGNDVNRIIDKLKNEEIWDWAELYRVGLIVTFHKQARSADYAFQTIKDPPSSYVEPDAIEQGIDLYLSKDSKDLITAALREQLKKLI